MVRNRFRPELRVGGYLLSGIVRWDDLKHSGDLNGDVDLSARIIFKGDWRHRALRDKAPVELMRGPACLWAGTLVEPDWDAGTIAAIGASRDADNALALDAAGNASTKPNEIIDAAIARGALSWTRVVDFGNTPVGDPDAGLTTIRSVLDAWTTQGNPVWHVDSRRRLITDDAEESKIRWLVTPGSGVLGASGTERVDVVVVRYLNKITGRRDTARHPAVSPTRPTESPKDITNRGPLTPAEAATIAAGLWAENNSGRPGWTNGLRLAGRQVTNLGGAVADLAFVRAPKAMALRSVPDPRGVSRNTSVVIGDYEFDWATGELQANPRGLAPQDEQSALDSVAELAATALAQSSGRGSTTPSGFATATAAQAMANNTQTTMTFSTFYGTAAMWDPAQPNRLTAPVGGTYKVDLTYSWVGAAGGFRKVILMVNGASNRTFQIHSVAPASNLSGTVSHSINLSAGDYIQLAQIQNVGGSVNSFGESYPAIALTRIGDVVL